MTPELSEAAAELVRISHSLFQRGYSFGTAGNISVRVGDVVVATPTGSSLGHLYPEMMAQVDLQGQVIGSIKPSKEVHFHLAAYRVRPQSLAVVHLHSTWATAVSCLRDLDTENALPPLTPYYAMRIPKLPVVPYIPPGDPLLGPEVAERMKDTPAILLRNHGSIAMGATLAEASALAEEVEETAKLHLLLGERALPLTPDQVAELHRRFG